MKRWLVLGMVFGLSACGSIKIRDVNESEVMKVRKVAIASFSFQQPNAAMSSGGPTLGKESEDAAGAMRDISGSLNKKMHWSVLSIEEMRDNPQYKQVYESKMKGWQTGKVPRDGKLMLAPGVMDAQSLRRLKPAERDQLMEALKVDALLETDVNIVFATNGVAVMGIGSRHPQAYINLWMYKRGIEKPVWFEGRLIGDASKESVGATGFWDENEVTRLGRLSAKSAFEKINLKQE